MIKTEIKILITTPKGCASNTEKKLRPFLIGNKAKSLKMYVNNDDNKILWVINCELRKAILITRNVTFFHKTINAVLRSRVVRKVSHLSENDIIELDKMLKQDTNIVVVNSENAPTLRGFNLVY